jgi:hypothetical protein
MSVLNETRIAENKIYDPNLPFPCGALVLILVEFWLGLLFLWGGMAVWNQNELTTDGWSLEQL